MGMKSLEEYRIDIVDVIKRQLGAAIRAKGGTVNDTDAWSAFVSAVNGLGNAGSKRWASGTATSQTSVTPFNTMTEDFRTGTTNFYLLPISGLSFIPSRVIVTRDYNNITLYLSNLSYKWQVNGDSSIGTIYLTDYSDITSGTFNVPVTKSNVSYDWIAFE